MSQLYLQQHHADNESDSSSSGNSEVDDNVAESDVEGKKGIEVQSKVEVDDDDTSSESQRANHDEDDEEDDSSSSGSEIVPAARKSVSTLLVKPKIGLFTSNPTRKAEGSGDQKPRLKLSLKLPTMKNAQLKHPAMPESKSKASLQKKSNAESNSESDDDSDEDGEINEVQAMVVDDEEAVEVDAVATAVLDVSSKQTPAPNGSKAKSSSSDTGSAGAGSALKKVSTSKPGVPSTKNGVSSSSKRRSFNPSKQIRIPPIPSPGLLLPSSSIAGTQGSAKGGNSSKPNGTNFYTLSEVFDASMEASGYTLEQRMTKPHRGSSVKRTVDDMFDTNVTFALHFPSLVPENLFKPQPKTTVKLEGNDAVLIKSEDISDKVVPASNGTTMSSTGPLDLFQQLVHAVGKSKKKKFHTNDTNGVSNDPKPKAIPSRKRKRPKRFCDLIPVSLTLPYPEDYIQKRVSYVDAVKKREQLIVKWQEAQENVEIAKEQAEEDQQGSSTALPESSFKNPVSIPDIPEAPEPPRLEDLKDFNHAKFYNVEQHPIYLPNAKDELVAHLDKHCFHITEGRYFGLSTNFIADQNFIGANAPGIAGVSSSGVSGLATSTAGGGSSSGGIASVLSSAYHNDATIVKPAATKESTKVEDKVKSESKTSSHKSSKSSSKQSTLSGVSSSKGSPSKKQSASSPVSKKPVTGPKPTASAADLRKIMDANGRTAEKFKLCIMRAAVHASRSGKNGQPFVGPDGETYPDVNKAFAAHAQVKPCQRCKNNKQGVYHCRLRRRHEEADFDGGKSAAPLAALFKAPMSSLLES